MSNFDKAGLGLEDYVIESTKDKFAGRLAKMDRGHMDTLDQRVDKLRKDIDAFCLERGISRKELLSIPETGLNAGLRVIRDSLKLLQYLEYLEDISQPLSR